MVASSIILSLPPHTSTILFKSKPLYSLHLPNSSLRFNPLQSKNLYFNLSSNLSPKKTAPLWIISATPADITPPATETIVETTTQIVGSEKGDGYSTIISALLLFAFIGLSILTVGVVYIGVTDFLQKRETKKFQEAEAAKNSKKKGKKKVVRSRTGPRGFGQKVNEFEEDDDTDL